MQTHTTLSLSKRRSPPCVLTIGNFDGMHLGHKYILEQMNELAGPSGTIAVVTFSNHPSHVLPGNNPASLLCSSSQKAEKLKNAGVDVLYLLEFTLELASLSYDVFLKHVRAAFPFDILVLGEGASFGKKREGTPEKIEKLGKGLGFVTTFLPKVEIQGETISSGLLRIAIEEGNFSKAEALLGAPFSVVATYTKGHLNFAPNQCLPKNGSYPIHIDRAQNALLKMENQKGFLEGVSLETKQKISLTFI